MTAHAPAPPPTQDTPLLRALSRFPVVAILRASTGAHLAKAATVLAAGGVTALEITATTPDAFTALAQVRRELGTETSLGIGTARTQADLDRAAEAGADFVVSPHTDTGLIRAAAARGLATLPGALTPTEALHAHGAGATAVKLYPAGELGLGYLTAIRAPLPDLGLVPTGSIAVEAVGAWLRAGALAVGLGSPLLGDSLRTGDLDAVRDRMAQLRRTVAEARREKP